MNVVNNVSVFRSHMPVNIGNLQTVFILNQQLTPISLIGLPLRSFVSGKRRGRPKWRWLDNIRNDLSDTELSGEEDRVEWRRLIRNIDPT